MLRYLGKAEIVAVWIVEPADFHCPARCGPDAVCILADTLIDREFDALCLKVGHSGADIWHGPAEYGVGAGVQPLTVVRRKVVAPRSNTAAK